jgi:hypothetical protein
MSANAFTPSRLHVVPDETDRRFHREPFENPWVGPKDGKFYWPEAQPRALRK